MSNAGESLPQPEFRGVDSAETLEEFQAKVATFTDRAIDEFERRYLNETDFTIEYFIDRSGVRFDDDGKGISLRDLQMLFYGIVGPRIGWLPGVTPYADYCTVSAKPFPEEFPSNFEYMMYGRLNEVHVEGLMHYAIIVGSGDSVR